MKAAPELVTSVSWSCVGACLPGPERGGRHARIEASVGLGEAKESSQAWSREDAFKGTSDTQRGRRYRRESDIYGGLSMSSAMGRASTARMGGLLFFCALLITPGSSTDSQNTTSLPADSASSQGTSSAAPLAMRTLTFKIINLNYTDNLNDSNSTEFKNLQDSLDAKLNPIYKARFPACFGVVVVSFSKGSVIVDAEVFFNSTSSLPTPEDFTSTLANNTVLGNFTVDPSSIASDGVASPISTTSSPPSTSGISSTSRTQSAASASTSITFLSNTTSPSSVISASQSNVTEPSTAVTTSLPNATITSSTNTVSVSNMTNSTPALTAYVSNMTNSTPAVTAYVSNITNSTPAATASLPNVTNSTPAVTAYVSNMTNSTPAATASLPNVTNSTPAVTAYVSNITNSTPALTAYVSNMTNSTLAATASLPNVTNSTPAVTAYVSNVTNSTSAVTAYVSNMTNSTSAVTAYVSNMTNSAPAVTAYVSNMTNSTLAATASLPNVTNSTAPVTAYVSNMTNSSSAPSLSLSTPLTHSSTNSTSAAGTNTTSSSASTSTSTAPVTSPTLSFRITSQNFSANLKNASSHEYIDLKNSLETLLTEIYKRKFPNCKAVKVIAFREGSVIVVTQVEFNDTSVPSLDNIASTLNVTVAGGGLGNFTVDSTSIQSSAASPISTTSSPPSTSGTSSTSTTQSTASASTSITFLSNTTRSSSVITASQSNVTAVPTSLTNVTNSTAAVTAYVSNMTNSTAAVTAYVSNMTNSAPAVTASLPNVTNSTPAVTAYVSNMTNSSSAPSLSLSTPLTHSSTNSTSAAGTNTTSSSASTSTSTALVTSATLSFRITSQNFSENLKNPSSPEYNDLKNSLETLLTEIYKRKFPNCKAVKVIAFREGSVIVVTQVEFNDTLVPPAENITSTLNVTIAGGGLGNFTVDPTSIQSSTISPTPTNGGSSTSGTQPVISVTTTNASITNTASPAGNASSTTTAITNTGPTSSNATVTAAPVLTLLLSFRITSENYTDNLNNSISTEFNTLKTRLEGALTPLYTKLPNCTGVKVTGFRKGSVIVDAGVNFIGASPNANAQDVIKVLSTSLSSTGSALGGFIVDPTSIQSNSSGTTTTPTTTIPTPKTTTTITQATESNFPGFAVAIIVMCSLAILSIPLLVLLAKKTDVCRKLAKACALKPPYDHLESGVKITNWQSHQGSYELSH
ncbi:uncharacterized protein LOC144826151 [Lissotriton helveticus]